MPALHLATPAHILERFKRRADWIAIVDMARLLWVGIVGFCLLCFLYLIAVLRSCKLWIRDVCRNGRKEYALQS
jgi:hypothetical protein